VVRPERTRLTLESWNDEPENHGIVTTTGSASAAATDSTSRSIH